MNNVIEQCLREIVATCHGDVLSGKMNLDSTRAIVTKIAGRYGIQTRDGQKRVALMCHDLGCVYKVALSAESIFDNETEVAIYQELLRRPLIVPNTGVNLLHSFVETTKEKGTFIVKQKMVTPLHESPAFHDYVNREVLTSGREYKIDVALLAYVANTPSVLSGVTALLTGVSNFYFLADVDFSLSYGNLALDASGKSVLYDYGSMIKKYISNQGKIILERCPECNPYGVSLDGFLDSAVPAIEPKPYAAFMDDITTGTLSKIPYVCTNPKCNHNYQQVMSGNSNGFNDFYVFNSYRNRYMEANKLDRLVYAGNLSTYEMITSFGQYENSVRMMIERVKQQNINVQAIEMDIMQYRDTILLYSYYEYAFNTIAGFFSLIGLNIYVEYQRGPEHVHNVLSQNGIVFVELAQILSYGLTLAFKVI